MLGEPRSMLSPAAYLERVLGLIQRNALRSPRVDWKTVKATCFEMIAGARSTEETYSAINYVLSQLGDNHSFLKDRRGGSTRTFTAGAVQFPKQTRVASPKCFESAGKKYCFMVVPAFGSSSSTAAATNFAKHLQKELSEGLLQTPAGWIVDLRGNGGGNMWPMLVGAGPLIGAGTLGYFEYPNTNIAWFYESGQAGVINKRGKIANFKLADSIPDLPNIPVAVLIDGNTASSAEALTISFKGRDNTCFVGSHTCGLATNNERKKLPDGALLYLTTSGEQDRNHVSYDSGIAPDIQVEQGNIPLGDKDDPGIKAAIGRLNSHTQ